MPKSRRFAAVSRLTFFGDLTLANTLDWAVTVILSILLAVTTLQLGGVRAETQLIGVWLSGLLLVVHSIWLLMRVRDKQFTFNGLPLLFLPFVMYVVLSWLLLTPSPWSARPEAYIALNAFVILWVTTQGLRTRNHIWFVLLVLGGIGFITVILAYNQYFRHSDWLPKLFNPIEMQTFELTGHREYMGRASGTFGAPNSLAGFLMLAFFPAVVSALSKQLSLILRVFAGYLAFMFFSGLLLTLSHGALLVFIPVALMTPWFCGMKRKAAIFSGIGLFLLGASIVAILLILSPRFGQRWESLLHGDFMGERPALFQAAWDNFLHHPIFGSGLGNYRYAMEAYRGEGFTGSATHVHNDYLEVLSDLGLVGGILLFGAIIVFILLAWRGWRVLPDRVLLDDVGRDRRHQRAMPQQKLLLSAAILSLLVVGLHTAVEFHLHLPAMVYWCSFLMAIVFKMIPPRPLKISAGRPRLVFTGTCAIFGLTLPLVSTEHFVGEIYTFEGERQGHLFAESFKELRNDAEFHDGRVAVLSAAVDAYPGQAEAQSLLGMAYADQSYVRPMERLELGQAGEAHARLAVEANPNIAMFQIRLAETLFLQERWEEANQAYSKAVELAPNNDVIWYYYANWLNGDPARRDEALEAIDRSLMLNPDDPAALALRRKILIP